MPARALITGASGFIGSRLCERMMQPYRVPFRALVRDAKKGRALVRLGAEVVIGDLLDARQIARALDGCDAVVHLAHGEDNEAPRATRNLARACVQANVKRLVHISSISVHGPAPGPQCAREQTAIIGRYNESYCDSKAEEEQIVQQAIDHDSLAAVILRPTVVYGPRAPFVRQVVVQARSGVVTLIDGGFGICNAVFIDDVCDAIHVALVRDGGVGQAMFVNGPKAIFWKEFIETFAATVTPAPRFEDVSAVAARQHWADKAPPTPAERLRRRVLRVPGVRGGLAVLRQALAAVQPRSAADAGRRASIDRWPSPGRITRETCSVPFSIDKARRILDWQPAYDFSRGAEVTRAWLQAGGG